MYRAAELFAVSTIALLGIGLLSRRLPIFSTSFVSVHIRSVAYGIAPEVVFFGLSVLFAIFAFVYSLWPPLNGYAATWHFFVSVIALLMVILAFASMQIAVASQPEITSLGVAGMSAAIATLGGVLLFVVGQIIFFANVVLAAIHRSQ